MTAPKPNLFLIGAAKAGTTALATYISEHEAGFLPADKEPSWFSDDYRRGETFYVIRDDADYLKLYEQADPARHRVVLDASTSYLMSRTAVANILKFNPDARFMALIRDPVEIAEAFHMEQVFNTFETEPDFEKAWRLQEARAEGREVPARCPEPRILQYREVASIGAQLERAAALIPEGRLLLLFQEDMKDDPRSVYRRALAHAGVEDDGREVFEPVGAAHFNRFPALAGLYQNPPGWLAPVIRGAKSGILTRFGPGATNAVKGLLMRRGERAGMSEAFRAELREVFAEDVARISRLTGRDLSHWR